MHKAILVSFAALAAAATAVPATAAVTFNVGDSSTVYFNGLADSFMGGVVAIPGLTSSLMLTLNNITGNTANFSYTLSNTSGGTVTSSRVSVFGFDVDTTNFTTAVGSAPFNIEIYNDDFPNVGGVNRIMDVCFKSAGGGGCSSGGGGGVTLGNSQAGTIALNFGSAITSVILNDFHVRYQSLNFPGVQGGSGVGDEVPSPFGVVPEPATWAMLIAGFGLVGVSMRRRRSGVATVSA